MQKKIIALAIAGLSGAAFAQSNVTISGKVQAGYEQYKVSDNGATSQSTENRISDQSSRLIIGGTEDLGGGLSAVWQVDSRFSIDQANNFAGVPNGWGTGNTFMGLRSATLGTFTLGHYDIHYGEFGAIEGNRAGSLQTNLTAGIMSQVNGATIAVGSRTGNWMLWDSPTWSGISARVGYSQATGTEGTGAFDGGKGAAWTMALRYNNGPITAGFSYYNNKAEEMTTATVPVAATGAFNTAQTNNAAAFAGPGAKQTSSRLWGGYTFPMGIKVGLGWDQSKTNAAVTGNETKRSAWILPVSYTTGAHAVYFTYAKAGNLSGNATVAGTTEGTNAKAYVLGYDYALSKRTSVGAYYTSLNNSSSAANVGAGYTMFGLGASGAQATTAGTDAKQIYMGMSHTF